MTRPISEKISELRRKAGLTQEKLGELCGVSSQAVSKWENGDSLPDIMLLPTLCASLGITADELLEVSADVKKKNCMEELHTIASKNGIFKTAYEAICASSLAKHEHQQRYFSLTVIRN